MGDAQPAPVALENSRAGLVGSNQLVDGEGEVELRFRRLAVFFEEGGQQGLQLREKGDGEAPAIQRNRTIGR